MFDVKQVLKVTAIAAGSAQAAPISRPSHDLPNGGARSFKAKDDSYSRAGGMTADGAALIDELSDVT